MQTLRFPIKNVTKEPFVIEAITASCSCTKPIFRADELKPGEDGNVEFSFAAPRAEADMMFAFKIHVRFKGQERETKAAEYGTIGFKAPVRKLVSTEKLNPVLVVRDGVPPHLRIINFGERWNRIVVEPSLAGTECVAELGEAKVFGVAMRQVGNLSLKGLEAFAHSKDRPSDMSLHVFCQLNDAGVHRLLEVVNVKLNWQSAIEVYPTRLTLPKNNTGVSEVTIVGRDFPLAAHQETLRVRVNGTELVKGAEYEVVRVSDRWLRVHLENKSLNLPDAENANLSISIGESVLDSILVSQSK